MFSWTKPASAVLAEFLETQKSQPLSYPDEGITQREPTQSNYQCDRLRVRLGQGSVVYRAGLETLESYRQLQLKWLEVYPAQPVREPGTVMLIVARVLGGWWVNPCRIVYTIDETGEIERQGFANGTLPEHIALGEERFLIEWNHADDSVWFEILAYSRPRHPLARLGYPVMRSIQKQFQRQSATNLMSELYYLIK